MKVFYNNKGKVAGWFNYGTYYKEVNSKKHLMKIYNAYAISQDIVHELDIMETKKIRLREKDTGRIFEVSMDNFLDKAFVKDWDGKQYFLPLKHWTLQDTTKKLF